MSSFRRRSTCVLILALMSTACAPRLSRHAVVPEPQELAAARRDRTVPDLWRSVARRLPAAARVAIELSDGSRLHGVVLGVADDHVLIRKRTRLPEAPLQVRYDTIESLELDEDRGIGAGKAAAIGVATGAATFVTLLLVTFALLDD